jgi:uncharacterized protein YbjQ (UPF0145 family)
VTEHLPSAAEARMAEIKASGTWGSALTTQEFAAIRSVGFEPVGQVLGAAVYNIGYTGGWGCPGPWSAYSRPMVGTFAVSGTSAVSGSGDYGSFAPMVQTLYQARHRALDRMIAECTKLGGHGVVGVRLTIGTFPAGGLEFKAIGTAVRAPGAKPLRHPFSSDLSGQDFAKLIAKGWVPAGLALGISIAARHDDWRTISQSRWSAGNTEVSGFTQVVNDARHDARRQLQKDVRRLGGEGVVIADMQMRVRERECPAVEGRRDHIVEATNIGTAIVRFSYHAESHESPALAIMSLNPVSKGGTR